MTWVSFVIPVRNGAATIRETLESVISQNDGRPMEVIVVDDQSRDGSFELLTDLTRLLPFRLLRADGRGAAAAINRGIRQARFPIICQIDQDVVLEHGWITRLAVVLEDPGVGAAQGWYATDAAAGVFARVMGRDLEERYASLRERVDHACTGNSAYSTEALYRVGLFDETLGYGYDNDMSYRLVAAGYRLVHCPEARSTHAWREGVLGYLRQQYGFGYGRLDLVAKHPRRVTGDAVSPLSMMAHPAVMTLALLSFAASAAVEGPLSARLVGVGVSLVLLLAVERLVRGARAAWRFRDPVGLLFPVVHLLRDLVWVAAGVGWMARRCLGAPPRPSHSMRPWTSYRRSPAVAGYASVLSDSNRVLGVIPAFNEASNLPIVVADVRTLAPAMDVLVVDDGSTDDTLAVVGRLGVKWLALPSRMGIGAAMRVALRYAVSHGYGTVVRPDGDGHHVATDIPRLLTPLSAGYADVVVGAREWRSRNGGLTPGGISRRILASLLTVMTGRSVMDPTCGFCALGPRAVRLLARHHPTGYPEAELRLFLYRNGMRVSEVPVETRSRLSGRTSLTPSRVAVAAARVLLAMCVVPFRRAVPDLAHD